MTHLPECGAQFDAQRNIRVDEHLPECIYTPEYFDSEQNIVWGGKPCICSALRACEQRVLAAAREAVAGLPVNVPKADALAAIDALRGES